MAVIALASFIVKSHNAYPLHNISRTVLIAMQGRRYWLRDFPDNQFKY